MTKTSIWDLFFAVPVNLLAGFWHLDVWSSLNFIIVGFILGLELANYREIRRSRV